MTASAKHDPKNTFDMTSRGATVDRSRKLWRDRAARAGLPKGIEQGPRNTQGT